MIIDAAMRLQAERDTVNIRCEPKWRDIRRHEYENRPENIFHDSVVFKLRCPSCGFAVEWNQCGVCRKIHFGNPFTTVNYPIYSEGYAYGWENYWKRGQAATQLCAECVKKYTRNNGPHQ